MNVVNARVEVFDLCFDFLDQNWAFSDFVLDLKLLLDRGIPVAKLHLLDFQSRNIIWLFLRPPFKIPSFLFALGIITAKCVMLRCKV